MLTKTKEKQTTDSKEGYIEQGEYPDSRCDICGKSYQFGVIPLLGEDRVFTFPACKCEDEDKMAFSDKLLVDKLKRRSGIPDKFANEHLQKWEKIKGTDKLVKAAKKYVEDFKENAYKGKGFFFVGNIGSGKTKLACYIANSIINQYQYSVRFVSFPRLISKIKTLKAEKRKGDLFAYLKELTLVDLLILDDFCESDVDPWDVEHYAYIIKERYDRSYATGFTTMHDREYITKAISGISKRFKVESAEDKKIYQDSLCQGQMIISRIYETCGDYLVNVHTDVDYREYEKNKKNIEKA